MSADESVYVAGDYVGNLVVAVGDEPSDCGRILGTPLR